LSSMVVATCETLISFPTSGSAYTEQNYGDPDLHSPGLTGITAPILRSRLLRSRESHECHDGYQDAGTGALVERVDFTLVANVFGLGDGGDFHHKR
jgi:hypothetical protein